MALYQCIKFHFIPFYTFRVMLRTSFLQKIKKGSNSVNTFDRAMIFAFCTSSDGPLSMYQVSFNSLVNFQRYAPDKLFIAKIKKGSNSVNTAGRVTIFALCTFADSPLSMYQVSFNSLIYFQNYAPDKVFFGKIKKESYCVNTGDSSCILQFPI